MIAALLIAGFAVVAGLAYGSGYSTARRRLEDTLGQIQNELEQVKAEKREMIEQHREDIQNTITVAKYHFAKKRTAAEHMHQWN
jgi:uncharacterized protein YicC (UPF0701 family)